MLQGHGTRLEQMKVFGVLNDICHLFNNGFTGVRGACGALLHDCWLGCVPSLSAGVVLISSSADAEISRCRLDSGGETAGVLAHGSGTNFRISQSDVFSIDGYSVGVVDGMFVEIQD